MNLPYLEPKQEKKKQIIEFKGYNHNLSIAENEFFEMKNLSSSLYPIMTTRKPRGTETQLIKPNGLTSKNSLIWVDGTDLYIDGVVKMQVSDTKKQFVSMGAYLLIFPDKKYYNTANGENGSLESIFTTSGSVFLVACMLDGTPSEVGSSLYAKIIATGIHNYFKQYDGVTIESSVAEINKTAVIQTIGTDFIVVATTLKQNNSFIGITVKRTVPDIDFVTESENRIWGCSSAKHEVYASKIGDPFNWNCYEGISTDSYAATIGSDGDFTGAITYLGYVLFFKENTVHKIYGNKPSNFQIFDNSVRGVAKGCENSLATVNETLYYMSRNGIMAYSGSLPESISYAFGDKIYTNGVGGGIGNKYYISLKDPSITNGPDRTLFVFDERLGAWHKEDYVNPISFIRFNNKLYYVDIDTKKIMSVEGTDEEFISWFGEFSDYQEKTINKKYVSKLQFRIELERDSLFEIEIQYDGLGVWEKICSLSGTIKESHTVPVSIRRSDYYIIRLSGYGPFKLYSLVKTYTEGSDL